MFRVFNHGSLDSEIRGWHVVTESAKNQSGRKHHNICLNGVEKGIRLALDRNKYENLTVVSGGAVYPNVNIFTKLYSIYIGADRYLPIITSAETAEENRNILLFNYETNPGEVIADIQFNNLIPISHYVSNKDFKSRISIAAIDIDNKKDYGITVKYGFNASKSLMIETVTFSNYFALIESLKNKDPKQNTEYFRIDNSHEKVERIEPARLKIARMDLSDVCINPQ